MTISDGFRFDFMSSDEVNLEAIAVQAQGAVNAALAERGMKIRLTAEVDEQANMQIDDERNYLDYTNVMCARSILMTPYGYLLESDPVTLLAVREACLATLSDYDGVWSNGQGDLYYDGTNALIEWKKVELAKSLFIEGPGITIPGGINAVDFQFHAPDDGDTHWAGIRKRIANRLAKCSQYVVGENFEEDDDFSGAMYLHTLRLSKSNQMPYTAADVAQGWEACLNGINDYRLAFPDGTIFVQSGVGTMMVPDLGKINASPPVYLGP